MLSDTTSRVRSGVAFALMETYTSYRTQLTGRGHRRHAGGVGSWVRNDGGIGGGGEGWGQRLYVLRAYGGGVAARSA